MGIMMQYKIDGNHIEIYFEGVPNQNIRETLKICGWHWYGKKKCWSNINNKENLIWAQKLSEEINPKPENPLLNMKKCQIGMTELIVRSNSFYCNQHHELEDLAGEIEVIDKKGNIITYLIPIAYCKSCDVYYVLEDTYLELKKNGVIRCEVLSYKEYANGDKSEFGELNSVGPLRKWGYTVSQNAGYSEIQRQGILEDIIDYHIMSKDEVLSYLNFFMKLNYNNSDIALAKWKEDRDYIAEYKIGSSKRRKIGRIIVHTYEKR